MTDEPTTERTSRLGAVPMIALYTLLGLLVGVIGSFTHRSRFAIGDVSIWYGVVVALACTLAFAIGLRRASRGVGVGIAFATGVSLGVLAIALGYSHSVVILSDIVGVLWMLGAPVIAFGVSMWPRLALGGRSAGRQRDQEQDR